MVLLHLPQLEDFGSVSDGVVDSTPPKLMLYRGRDARRCIKR